MSYFFLMVLWYNSVFKNPKYLTAPKLSTENMNHHPKMLRRFLPPIPKQEISLWVARQNSPLVPILAARCLRVDPCWAGVSPSLSQCCAECQSVSLRVSFPEPFSSLSHWKLVLVLIRIITSTTDAFSLLPGELWQVNFGSDGCR